MKKLFLMLVVFFTALCLFVSCDDGSSNKKVVSAWKNVVVDEENGHLETITKSFVFYDDGSFDLTTSYQCYESGQLVEEESHAGTGTYSAISDKAGLLSITAEDKGEIATLNGTYDIRGNKICILLFLEKDEDLFAGIGFEELTKVSFVSNSGRSSISSWRGTKTEEDDPYYNVDNYELVFYDDGTFKLIDSYIYKINGEVDKEGTANIEGTYTATSDTTGTYTYTYNSKTADGSYIIEGKEIRMSHTVDENTINFELTKVEE